MFSKERKKSLKEVNSINLNNFEEWGKEYEDVKHLLMPKPDYGLTVILTILYVFFLWYLYRLYVQ